MEHGDALMQVACASGNLEAVKYLYSNGIQFNTPPKPGEYTDKEYRKGPYIL